ncbi:universal stress protein [Sinorhizobium fredii]|uniref:universal stress protein n=1 Tax=Rhizobium fredii TaxID=380 RepID=UPI0035139B2F
MACLDTSWLSHKVIPHAVAIANALHASLTLLHVLEVAPTTDVPLDPFEWDVRRRAAHDYIKRLASERGDETFNIDTIVVEGQPAEQICLWARNQRAGLIAVGTHGDSGAVDWALGDTARKLVETCSGALLLVPSSASDTDVVHYRRLLVPLDGSSRAESVLPLATVLAKAQDAELLLTHIVPVPELTEIGPLEVEDIRLKDAVIRRNERVARQYLDCIRARLTEHGLAVNVILRDGDVRGSLSRLAVEEAADLVILSAHGRGGRADVSCGSIASFLVTHTATPLLIVRRGSGSGSRASTEKTNGRPPGRAVL